MHENDSHFNYLQIVFEKNSISMNYWNANYTFTEQKKKTIHKAISNIENTPCQRQY